MICGTTMHTSKLKSRQHNALLCSQNVRPDSNSALLSRQNVWLGWLGRGQTYLKRTSNSFSNSFQMSTNRQHAHELTQQTPTISGNGAYHPRDRSTSLCLYRSSFKRVSLSPASELQVCGGATRSVYNPPHTTGVFWR